MDSPPDGMPSMSIHRVTAPVRQQIYDLVRAAIVDMHFGPGRRLTERELQQLTGVSRPTIREALQQLATEGLVVTIPGKGWSVASPTDEEVADLYAIRSQLEGMAGRLFVERASEADREQLSEAFEEVTQITKFGDDVKSILAVKEKFYVALFQGAKSDTLVTIISGLQSRVTAMRAQSMREPGRPAASVREIRAIMEAIGVGDADAAEQECRFHVQQAARAAFSAMTRARAKVGETADAGA